MVRYTVLVPTRDAADAVARLLPQLVDVQPYRPSLRVMNQIPRIDAASEVANNYCLQPALGSKAG